MNTIYEPYVYRYSLIDWTLYHIDGEEQRPVGIIVHAPNGPKPFIAQSVQDSPEVSRYFDTAEEAKRWLELKYEFE